MIVRNIDSILNIIQARRISAREVEQQSGMSNGTLGKAAASKKDLSEANLKKFVEKFPTDIRMAGYKVSSHKDHYGNDIGTAIIPIGVNPEALYQMSNGSEVESEKSQNETNQSKYVALLEANDKWLKDQYAAFNTQVLANLTKLIEGQDSMISSLKAQDVKMSGMQAILLARTEETLLGLGQQLFPKDPKKLLQAARKKAIDLSGQENKKDIETTRDSGDGPHNRIENGKA